MGNSTSPAHLTDIRREAVEAPYRVRADRREPPTQVTVRQGARRVLGHGPRVHGPPQREVREICGLEFSPPNSQGNRTRQPALTHDTVAWGLNCIWSGGT